MSEFALGGIRPQDLCRGESADYRAVMAAARVTVF